MIPRYRHLLKSARCNRVFDGKQGRYVDIIRSHFSGKNDDTMMENAIDCKTDKTVIMKAEDKMKMQVSTYVGSYFHSFYLNLCIIIFRDIRRFTFIL